MNKQKTQEQQIVRQINMDVYGFRACTCGQQLGSTLYTLLYLNKGDIQAQKKILQNIKTMNCCRDYLVQCILRKLEL